MMLKWWIGEVKFSDFAEELSKELSNSFLGCDSDFSKGKICFAGNISVSYTRERIKLSLERIDARGLESSAEFKAIKKMLGGKNPNCVYYEWSLENDGIPVISFLSFFISKKVLIFLVPELAQKGRTNVCWLKPGYDISRDLKQCDNYLVLGNN